MGKRPRIVKKHKFKCSYCIKKYKTFDGMLNHLNRKHSGEKPKARCLF